MTPPTAPSPPPPPPERPYAGSTRFELELEFVQMLSHPPYLQHLAAEKSLDNPAFVAYLSYLQYWATPPYLPYLIYAGPTLRALELLQQARFRSEILVPGVVERMIREGVGASSARSGG